MVGILDVGSVAAGYWLKVVVNPFCYAVGFAAAVGDDWSSWWDAMWYRPFLDFFVYLR